ncbi:MAG: hypothetical protein LQ343_007758 [Gyalolechia ehrenbergii]|nr:MAG: hypothetical protein LQ343_007758 [Gyalolechia ehrenbergii]
MVGIPIEADEIYRVAFEMMFEITDHPIMQPWLDQDWHYSPRTSSISIRHIGYGKDPSRLYTQYLIWGLNHVLLSMALMDRYCQTTAVLKWEGNPVGRIEIAQSQPVEGPGSPHNQSILVSPARNNALFTIALKYSEKPIPKELVYLTAIKAMGEACEKGLPAPVPGMITTGLQKVTWKMLTPSRRVRTIEAGYSRLAVAKSLARMVLDDRFVEVLTWARVDGVVAAVGGFTQGT